jgi:hypothetical protein
MRPALVVVAIAACSRPDRDPPARPPAKTVPTDADADAAAPPDAGAKTMTVLTCQDARAAIEARRFIGWTGLPAGCDVTETFGIALEAEWTPRLLGRKPQKVRRNLLELPGYRQPLLSVGQDGAVLMFDGHLPDVDGGWPALQQDLGAPDAKLDYVNGLLGATPQGEWVYASRGITVFVNSDTTRLMHVAVYPVTTVERWEDELRFDLEVKRTPRR